MRKFLVCLCVFVVLMGILCNTVSAQTFTDASLSGTYFFSGYGESSSDPDRWSQIGTMTFDGAGSTTYSITYSSTRDGINLTASGSGAYSVSSDGTVIFNGFPGETGETTKGAIQEGGNAIVFGDVDEQQEQIFGVLVLNISDLVLFVDVPPGHWAEESIYKIYNAGITQGCSQNPLMFCPNVVTNREQMAVFLGRGLHGSGFTPPDATGIFSDVSLDHWAADWIEQA